MRSRGLPALGIGALWLGLAGSVAAHGSVPSNPPDAAGLLLGWSFEPLILLPLILGAVIWWRMTGRINAAHPDNPVPRYRRWAFLGGLAVIAIALDSGIERWDTTLFSVHMVQHVLLTLVAPPLIAIAAPITQLLRAARRSDRTDWILPVLNSRVMRVVGHPAVAWIVFTGVMWGTHFSPLFNHSLEDRFVHDLEHVLYLGAGLLFWWPVVAADPAPHRMRYPARIAYVFLQMPQNSFLAMAILFAEGPLYAHYATLGSPYGITALDDQRLAGGIMWFLGDVIFLIATLLVVNGWLRSEERAGDAAERRDDADRQRIREREEALRLRRAATPAAPDSDPGPRSPH